MAEPVIRPARPDEAGPLRALALRGKAHWGPPADYLAAWADALDISPAFLRQSVSFVLEQNGAAQGFYSLIWEAAPTRAGGHTLPPGWWLDNLFVEPAAIGTGLGARLYRHALKEAAARGASCLTLISDANAAAFYRHMGATFVGEMPSMVPWVALPVYQHHLEGAASADDG